MYMNTTYKAFVAETAAKIAAEISKEFITARDVSLLKNDEDTQLDIAVAAVSVSEKLADKLIEWWECNGDHATIMFDVDDSLNSGIERELSSVAVSIDDFKDELKELLDKD